MRVFGYVSNRDQPKDDEQTVSDADVTDLDSAAVDTYLELLLRGVRKRLTRDSHAARSNGDASHRS